VIPTIDPRAEREHERRNFIHTVLLLSGIGAVIGLASWLIWGAPGVPLTVLIVGLLLLLGPRVSPEAVMRMYRAVPVDPRTGGALIQVVDELAGRAGLAKAPRLYVVPSLTINAFAAGEPQRSTIAVTEGLLRRLSLREIAGVLAHEISHIRNKDLAVLGLADTMSRLAQALPFVAIFLLALNLLGLLTGDQAVPWSAVALLYLAPTITSLLQLALSRTREYTADHGAAILTGDPRGLASALNRLERHTGHFWEDLVLPVPGRRIPQPSLLRSHPSTQERITRLLDLAADPTLPPLVIAEAPMVTMVGVGPIAMRPRHRFPGVWY